MVDVSFRLDHAVIALARTPAVLYPLLHDLPDEWVCGTDGLGTWSPHQVVAHLLDGERTDWVVRAQTILARGETQPFVPYNRDTSLVEADRQSLDALLRAFDAARAENVAWLREADLTERDLDRTGTHPALGVVTLRQLLATWVAHDHGHVVQITRTLARLYRDEVGPWAAYLSVMAAPRGS